MSEEKFFLERVLSEDLFWLHNKALISLASIALMTGNSKGSGHNCRAIATHIAKSDQKCKNKTIFITYGKICNRPLTSATSRAK